jgi:serine/threonine protein kinase
MNADRYRKAGEIYHAALALPTERRAAFLEQSCAGDLDLLGDVESLLAAHASAGHFIEELHPHVGTFLDESRLAHGRPESRDGSIDEASADSTESWLTPGQHLGRYEVLDLLGSGGMGSVYRALDPSLGREVAIKALARTFRDDSASLRRFEREARVLATLSHPNIATIYGFERLDGAPYLVLERVDGETLADRLMRGAISVDVALDVAAQIVAGLEEAHGKGVVHRDLKPSNVMLTPDGRVKLVDFGLAKTLGTRTALDVSAEPITSPGVVLGTARYMSPEQVKGENVDTRTDVWAFGCVLYEMLTARPVFPGRSVSEVVAAVLRDDPDWQALPADAPRNVGRLLRRCMRRDARIRLQHIGDARLELMEVEDEPHAETVNASRTTTSRRVRWSPRRWSRQLARSCSCVRRQRSQSLARLVSASSCPDA